MASLITFERRLALLFACMENVLHGIIIAGWPSLVFVFIQLGYFSHLCEYTNQNETSSEMFNSSTPDVGNHSNLTGSDVFETCPEQDSRLQLVFSVAFAFQSPSMLPVALFFNHFGTRVSRFVMSIFLLVGYLFMAFSSPTYPFLIFPGTVCFSIGGVFMLFTLMQVGNLFGKKKSTAMALINAMYSAAVIVPFIAKNAYEAGLPISTFFFIMAGSVIFLHINTFLLLPTTYIPWPLPEEYRMTPSCTPKSTPGVREEGPYDNQGHDVEESSNNVTVANTARTGTVFIISDHVANESISKNDQACRYKTPNLEESTSKYVGVEAHQTENGEFCFTRDSGNANQSGQNAEVISNERDAVDEHRTTQIAGVLNTNENFNVDPNLRQIGENVTAEIPQGHVLYSACSDERLQEKDICDGVGNPDHSTMQAHSEESALEERKNKEYGSLRSCILSPQFFLLLLWQAVLEVDLSFTIGTLTFFLTRLANGDEDQVSWYTNVFSISLFFVVIVGPAGGFLMDRNKLTMPWSSEKKCKDRGTYADMQDSCLPLAITSLASIGYSVCLQVPILRLQYLTFIFFLIAISLLYCVGASVVAIVFPMQYFTSVYGTIRTISGICVFLQYPIFILIQKYLDDDPFKVFIAFVAADVTTLILPASLYVRSRRNEMTDCDITLYERR